MLARRLLFALLVLATGADGARLPLQRASPSLPGELVWHILGHIRWPGVVVVAWGDEIAVMAGAGPRHSFLPAQFAQGGRVVNLKFLPSGDRFVAVLSGGACSVWCARSGRPLATLRDGHDFGAVVFDTDVFPDGERLVTLASDAVAVIWNISTGEALSRVRLHHVAQQRAVRVLQPGDRIITGVSRLRQDPVAIWSVATGESLGVLEHTVEGDVVLLEMSPCGTKLVTVLHARGSAYIFVWNALNLRLEVQMARRDQQVAGVALSPGGARLAIAYWAFGVEVVGLRGELPWRAAAPGGVMRLLSPTQRLATLQVSGGVVRDLRSGRQLATLEGSEGFVRMAASPLGDVLAACGRRRAAVWDAATGRRWAILGDGRGQMGGRMCVVAVGPSQSSASYLLRG